MSILNEPRKPDCDVCDWATSYWWAHGLNLCQADFELVRKVVKTEQERIRNLLGEFGMKLEKEVSDGDNYSLGRYNAISEFIAILDGELHE